MKRDLRELNIAVLAGGTSSEREISIQSGRAVAQALQESGFHAELMDPKESFMDELHHKKIDFVFIAMHGAFGEDGTLQTLLDKEEIPYSGSRSEACRRAMDKEIARRLCTKMGILVPEGVVLHEGEKAPDLNLTWPVFVKPVQGGSSIGVTQVYDPKELQAAMKSAWKEDSRLIIEERIPGRELTVGILGRETLPILEIQIQRPFFDYKAKYLDVQTRYAEPKDLSQSLKGEIQGLAMRMHEALGCSVFSRVDFILNGDRPYVLELNAVPGLTQKSLLPKMAALAGIGFGALCRRIIEHSLLLRTFVTK